MIQLYLPNNISFQNNGDIVLLPIDCEIKAEINGEWSLSLSHPIDDEGRWRYIVENAVIKAPSFNGEQLFRIVEKDKRDSGVTAVAQPIFLDAIGDCFIQDIRPTNKNGQEALDLILSPSEKYSGRSNIVDRATAYYMLVNAMEAIAGEDNSFLSRWGGEILYNNYEIIINGRVGGDYGYQILYGRNIPTDGIHETVDVTNVVTRIVPQAYNGRMLSGQTKWVDSPLIDEYPLVFTKVIKYENIVLKKDLQGGDADGKTVCNNQSQLNTALRNACMEEFDKGIDKPSVSIEADMVLLQNTDEYKDYAILERVGLGDTVHLKHSRLNIIADARVIGLVFDCVREQVTSVTIGDVQANIMNNLSSTMQSVEKAITPAGRVVAEQIQGLIDGSQAQLRLQNDVAERQDVRAILFEDLDETSPTFGAMSLGTQGFEISRERTADGQDWVWSTFGTAEGFNADLITAGTIQAIDINGSTITGGTINGTTINGSTIRSTKTYTGQGGITITDTSALYDGKLEATSTLGNFALDVSGGRLLLGRGSGANRVNVTVGTEAGIEIAGSGYTSILGSSYLSSHTIYAQDSLYIGSENALKYESGDSFSLSLGAVYSAHITNSTKSLDFFIPLPKKANGLTVTATIDQITVRSGGGGYVDGSQYIALDNTFTTTATGFYSGVRVRLTKASAYTNVVNNQACAVQASLTLTFS